MDAKIRAARNEYLRDSTRVNLIRLKYACIQAGVCPQCWGDGHEHHGVEPELLCAVCPGDGKIPASYSQEQIDDAARRMVAALQKQQ